MARPAVSPGPRSSSIALLCTPSDGRFPTSAQSRVRSLPGRSVPKSWCVTLGSTCCSCSCGILPASRRILAFELVPEQDALLDLQTESRVIYRCRSHRAIARCRRAAFLFLCRFGNHVHREPGWQVRLLVYPSVATRHQHRSAVRRRLKVSAVTQRHRNQCRG
jgi:hypothetical protein